VRKLFGILLVVALVLSLSLVATMPVAAQTDRHVPSQYPTIQDAIDDADPGDTILVDPNTYEEQLTITTAGLTVRPANNTGPVIVSLPDSGLATDWIAGRMRTWVILVEGVDDVTIQGLTVCGADGSPEEVGGDEVHLLGIVYDDASGTIRGNIIQNIRRGEPGTANDYFSYSKCILVSGPTDDTMIHDNTVYLHEHGKAGISVLNSPPVATLTIVGNEVFGVGDDMVHNWNHSGISVMDTAGTVVIIDNDLEDIRSPTWTSRGIYIISDLGGISGDITITENRVTEADTGIFVFAPPGLMPISGDLTLSDNTVSGCRQNVRLQLYAMTGDVVMSHNTISGAIWDGVVVWDQGGTIDGDLILRHNSIYDNAGYGLYHLSTTVVDAILNWWGHASGPDNNPENLGGKGNAVGDDAVFMPWLMEEGGPDLTETNTGFGVDAEAQTDNVSATADGGAGDTTVTVGEYVGNPTAVNPGFVLNDEFYFDVHVDGELPGELEVSATCPGGDCSGVILKWFDGTEWLEVSPVSYTNGEVVAELDDVDSSPLISELTGTPFGLGNPTPPLTVGWEGSPVDKARVMAPWIALLSVIAGASLLVLRRRQTQS